MSENLTRKNISGSSSVLITGGSGLVGRYLTSALLDAGYKVAHLSRKANQFGKVRVFRWDPEKRIIDPEVFSGIDYVVHLSGANLGSKRWSRERKNEIMASRIESARLIYNVVKENNIKLKAFISASGISYYGSLTSDKVFSEDDPAASDFLAQTCKEWEEASDLFTCEGVRTVKLRTAVVLERDAEILHNLLRTARFGFLPRLGSGKQYLPWIHISDLCNIYLKAIEDDTMSGSYNAVAPRHINHRELMNILAGYTAWPRLVIPIPAPFIRLFLEQMSDLLLQGSRVSSEKLISAGYQFGYDNTEDALSDLLAGQKR